MRVVAASVTPTPEPYSGSVPDALDMAARGGTGVRGSQSSKENRMSETRKRPTWDEAEKRMRALDDYEALSDGLRAASEACGDMLMLDLEDAREKWEERVTRINAAISVLNRRATPSPEAPVEEERARCLDLTGRVVDEYARQTGDVLNEVVLLEAISAAGLFATTPQPEGALEGERANEWTETVLDGLRELSDTMQERDLRGCELQARRGIEEILRLTGRLDPGSTEPAESADPVSEVPEEEYPGCMLYGSLRPPGSPAWMDLPSNLKRRWCGKAERDTLLTALQEADEALEWAVEKAEREAMLASARADGELAVDPEGAADHAEKMGHHAQALARLRELTPKETT